ncbi:hypothetical protein RhiirA4_491576 [Rhizophagus irregularis]|uniref:Uncharacterized protein n=1 Tax=Rhizophagus irregularis TaxID=588596 RepID=A0A2I1HWJ7_9GLOM|nr:hypothetical protein RhiirA4_491576 [Rhizophagus irregularis]
MYAELFGLLKKAIDYATKADMQHELLNVFKAFIYDDLHRKRRVLKDIINVVEENCISSHIEDSASGTKGQKCSKYNIHAAQIILGCHNYNLGCHN